MTKLYSVLVAACLIFSSTPGSTQIVIRGGEHPELRQQHPDEQIRQQIIQESVAAYLGTGHPCACPYNSARDGSSCGQRSAYSRPGGASPLCYPSDVTDEMDADWRQRHGDE